MKESRQVIRKKLFDAEFYRYRGGEVPRGLAPRHERRRMARAFAVGEYRRGLTNDLRLK